MQTNPVSRRLFKRVFLSAFAAGLAFSAAPTLAAGDLTRQESIEIRLQLGTPAGELNITPNELELETGKLYKLVLNNPGPAPHYFTSPLLSGAVFTRKVQVNGSDAKAIGEVKGLVSEIEVFPGGTVEWWFVPVKTGSGEMRNSLPGKTEQGLAGKVGIR